MNKILLIINKPRHGIFHEHPCIPCVGERFTIFWDGEYRELIVTDVRMDEDAPNIAKCFIDFI